MWNPFVPRVLVILKLCGLGWFGRVEDTRSYIANNIFVLPCVVQCLKSVPLLCRVTLAKAPSSVAPFAGSHVS